MPVADIQRLGVVGFGTMGSEIALLAAAAGLEVLVHSRNLEQFEATRTRLGKILKLLTRDPKFFAAAQLPDDSTREAALARLNYSDALEGLAACDCVIESAPEELMLKQDIFRRLAAVCAGDALLATNTSSISITALAEVTPQPERVVGLHFFNPPVQMQLVEVVPGLQTSVETVERGLALCARLGKKGIRVREVPGFVVNRVLIAMMNEAIELHEAGVASIEDIDEAMKLGAGLPLGPFKLADLVGLDVYLSTCESLYAALNDVRYRPTDLLRRLVAEGRLGRKTRYGFYKY